MYQKTRKQILALMIAGITIIIIGMITGWLYSRLPVNNPQDSEQGCESVGGDWDNVVGQCLLSYKKAGEICVSGGQCVSGICSPPALTEEQQSSLPQGPLINIIGTCSANNEPIGCVPQVIKGTISMNSMCLREQH